jgi:hypothetical protein
MSNQDGSFKRINFFRGFLTTEEDWNDAEAYHIRKHRLHNRTFHAPGVVAHAGGGLKVTSRKRDDLAVEVARGYAVDGQGHDIWVPEPVFRVFNAKDFKLPQTIFLTAQFVEEPADFVTYKENPEFRGHRKIEEKFTIQFTNVEPDIEREVELARVAVTEDVRRISDARDPMNPGPNEIDLRYVPYAGVVGPFLDPYTLHRIHRMVRVSQMTYSFLAYDLGIRRAQDVLHAVITLEMLLLCRQVDLRNFMSLNRMVLQLQHQLISDLDKHHPHHASTREFLNFKNQIRFLEELEGEHRPDMERADHIIGFQTKACEALQGLHAYRIETRAAGQIEAPSSEALWEQVKPRSTPFEKELELDGQRFVLVDEFNVLDPRSEKAHAFEVAEYKDMYRSRQRYMYPDSEDGATVEDEGLAYQGGFAQFEVRNVKLMRPLILVFRIDYTHGEWKAGIVLNGTKKAGDWSVVGRDRRFRWRNWPLILPAEMVDSDHMTIRLEFKEAGRDINLFRVWAYQPVG